MRDMRDMRSQCPWMPSWLTRLYIERATYDRAGRLRGVVTAADVEAELAEVARRRGQP
jgi:hypothetical protein